MSQLEMFIMVNGKKERKMVEENIILLMEKDMKVIGLIMLDMVKVYTFGIMVNNIMENGNMIK